MEEHHKEIFEAFDFLENDNNYFAKREGLKTQYMVLVKYESMRRIYTNDKDHLKMVMTIVLDQNKGIQYEAFLLMSLFILMPRDNEKVYHTL